MPWMRGELDAGANTAIKASLSRRFQFAQSVRNAESVVGTVFPADLFVGAGSNGVPVARSDLVVLGVEHRPAPGMRIGAQLFARALDDLLLVAPRGGAPFMTGAFAVGDGLARGLSIDAAMSGTRYGLLASYGLQRTQYSFSDSSYTPEHASRHVAEFGVVLFPSATISVQAGVTAAVGRHTTAIPGAFEWESCSLLDQGCEFGGSPQYDADDLGKSRLPMYGRVDLGIRKHWHVDVGNGEAMVALFGTITNVFARKNALTYAADANSGERVAVPLRPLGPLVVGIDWRY
jgi:hypothetical protein